MIVFQPKSVGFVLRQLLGKESVAILYVGTEWLFSQLKLVTTTTILMTMDATKIAKFKLAGIVQISHLIALNFVGMEWLLEMKNVTISKLVVKIAF